MTAPEAFVGRLLRAACALWSLAPSPLGQGPRNGSHPLVWFVVSCRAQNAADSGDAGFYPTEAFEGGG